MASYSLHLPADGDISRAKLVRDGGLLALMLPPFYLAVHRLWFGLVVFVLVILAILLTAGFAGLAAVPILIALASLFVWLEGGQMRRRALERAGWTEIGPVEAASREQAELRLIAMARSRQQNRTFGEDTEPARGGAGAGLATA